MKGTARSSSHSTWLRQSQRIPAPMRWPIFCPVARAVETSVITALVPASLGRGAARAPIAATALISSTTMRK